MENVTESLLTNPSVFTAVIVGVCVIFLVYIVKLLRREERVEITPKNEKPVRTEKKKETATKSKKKLAERENRRTARNEKQNFTHPWLLTTLKGHTGRVLDIEFSSNGKYLASCADEDPGDLIIEGSSSSSDSTKESRPPSTEPSPNNKLSRRQRKNRKRDSRPPKKKPIKPTAMSRGTDEPSLLETQKMVMSEKRFTEILYRCYVMERKHLMLLNYPLFLGSPIRVGLHGIDFYPKKRHPSDSGHGSSSDTDTSSSSEDVSCPQRDYVHRRRCVRCSKAFTTTSTRYVNPEKCSFHPGRLLRSHDGRQTYACCKGNEHSVGCDEGPCHVWNGPTVLIADDSFIQMESRRNEPQFGHHGVYALDCEMCYTVAGLEVTKVCVVNMYGRLVYDAFVRPEHEIVDYNTKYSGILPEHFVKYPSKSLREVQEDLKSIITRETILIGHGLENDLRKLKIVHTTVVDTAFLFPHRRGFPSRRSLKELTKMYLGRDVQCSDEGHDGYEDARAAMELVLYKVREDYLVQSKYDDTDYGFRRQYYEDTDYVDYSFRYREASVNC